MTLSARNHLKGTVEEIQLGDVLAHVTIRVADGVIESVITRRSAEEMGLTKGDDRETLKARLPSVLRAHLESAR